MDRLTLACRIALAPSVEAFKALCGVWITHYGQGVPGWVVDAFVRAHPLTPKQLCDGLRGLRELRSLREEEERGRDGDGDGESAP
jgi:hypothetical protein